MRVPLGVDVRASEPPVASLGNGMWRWRVDPVDPVRPVGRLIPVDPVGAYRLGGVTLVRVVRSGVVGALERVGA